MNENIDATTAMGRAMPSMIAVFSQLEREVIGERTREAMRFLKAQRRAYSRPVYGYDKVAGQLRENEHEQVVTEHSHRRSAASHMSRQRQD
jgi:DNA invertase Pin-like site-specific DNA recombinase